MRFFLVIAIWIVVVGGLWGYISQRDAKRLLITTPTSVNSVVEGRFAIEITPTFSIEEDPFALTTTDSPLLPIELKLNGIGITFDTENVMRGKTIRLENVTGMLAGHNEIYINASPPMSENLLEHGMRVKFFEDSDIVVDETVWGTQGALVSGTVSFSYQGKEEVGHEQ